MHPGVEIDGLQMQGIAGDGREDLFGRELGFAFLHHPLLGAGGAAGQQGERQQQTDAGQLCVHGTLLGKK